MASHDGADIVHLGETAAQIADSQYTQKLPEMYGFYTRQIEACDQGGKRTYRQARPAGG